MSPGSSPPPPPPLSLRSWPRSVLWISIALGLAYGLSMRGLFHVAKPGVFQIMSSAYLFGVPFGLGVLQVFVSESAGRRSWAQRMFIPWVPVGFSLLAALLLFWEGIICILVILPVMLLMASIGGLCAGLARDLMRPVGRNLVFMYCLVLPMVLAPVEQLRSPERQIRRVETAIEIHAPAAAIWEQIQSVPRITAAEQVDGWVYRVGFPRPLAATLSHAGVGGVRRASFERGVLFIETITRWEPASDLAFSIRADTASIPPTTLDEHVTVGGPYFDVLEGEYHIERLGERRAILHLSSRHRLSTRFNTYASMWTDAIMRNIQDSILQVIRRRAETAGALADPPKKP